MQGVVPILHNSVFLTIGKITPFSTTTPREVVELDAGTMAIMEIEKITETIVNKYRKTSFENDLMLYLSSLNFRPNTTSNQNCSSSVEPDSARVEPEPPVMTVETSSK